LLARRLGRCLLLNHDLEDAVVVGLYDPLSLDTRPQRDDLLSALEPDLCLVGHHHEHAEGTFGPTRVVTLRPVWDGYYLLDPETLTLKAMGPPE
jgi:hypothetical protein